MSDILRNGSLFEFPQMGYLRFRAYGLTADDCDLILLSLYDDGGKVFLGTPILGTPNFSSSTVDHPSQLSCVDNSTFFFILLLSLDTLLSIAVIHVPHDGKLFIIGNRSTIVLLIVSCSPLSSYNDDDCILFVKTSVFYE